MSSLTTCSGQGVLVHGKEKEKFKEKHKCDKSNFLTEARKPKSNLLKPNYIIKSLDKGQKDWNYTQEPGSNNSAKEDSGDEGDWGDTYSSHSTLCVRIYS